MMVNRSDRQLRGDCVVFDDVSWSCYDVLDDVLILSKLDKEKSS